MAKRGFFFTWFDLAFPWAACLVGAGLCTWAGVVAAPVPAKIICLTLAVACFAGPVIWYALRWGKTAVDYTSNDGLEVVLGSKNRPARAHVEALTREAIITWTTLKWDGGGPLDEGAVRRALPKRGVEFVDVEEMSSFGRKLRGYSNGYDAVVGFNGDPAWTDGLFKHELDHIVYFQVTGVWDEEEHHRVFASRR